MPCPYAIGKKVRCTSKVHCTFLFELNAVAPFLYIIEVRDQFQRTPHPR